MMKTLYRNLDEINPNVEERRRNVECMVPPMLRNKSIIVYSSFNPHFYLKLPPERFKPYNDLYAEGMTGLKASGVECMSVGLDFSPDDFLDQCHLAQPGQEKLAELITPKVRALAERLGYVTPEQP
jgi:hypothetical protein